MAQIQMRRPVLQLQHCNLCLLFLFTLPCSFSCTSLASSYCNQRLRQTYKAKRLFGLQFWKFQSMLGDPVAFRSVVMWSTAWAGCEIKEETRVLHPLGERAHSDHFQSLPPGPSLLKVSFNFHSATLEIKPLTWASGGHSAIKCGTHLLLGLFVQMLGVFLYCLSP